MKTRILLIDADDMILGILRETLSEEGYDVTAVNGTSDILSLLNCVKPNLMLIDYRLRGASGKDICRSVKNHPIYQKLPIIMLSAWPSAYKCLQRKECNLFIAKPFDLWGLVDSIATLLAQNFCKNEDTR